MEVKNCTDFCGSKMDMGNNQDKVKGRWESSGTSTTRVVINMSTQVLLWKFFFQENLTEKYLVQQKMHEDRELKAKNHWEGESNCAVCDRGCIAGRLQEAKIKGRCEQRGKQRTVLPCISSRERRMDNARQLPTASQYAL